MLTARLERMRPCVPPGAVPGIRFEPSIGLRAPGYTRGMGKVHEGIGPSLAEWISAQRMFFVATAPLAAHGLINCSPKGMDSFRILGPR